MISMNETNFNLEVLAFGGGNEVDESNLDLMMLEDLLQTPELLESDPLLKNLDKE